MISQQDPSAFIAAACICLSCQLDQWALDFFQTTDKEKLYKITANQILQHLQEQGSGIYRKATTFDPDKYHRLQK